LFRLLFGLPRFRYISVHSGQLGVTQTRSHIVPPTSCGMQHPL